MQSLACVSYRVRIHVLKNCIHHATHFYSGAGWLSLQSPGQTGSGRCQQTGRGRRTARLDLYFAVCKIVCDQFESLRMFGVVLGDGKASPRADQAAADAKALQQQAA